MKREASGTKKTRDKLAKKSQFGIIDEHALNLSQEFTVKYHKTRKFVMKKVKLKTLKMHFYLNYLYSCLLMLLNYNLTYDIHI